MKHLLILAAALVACAAPQEKSDLAPLRTKLREHVDRKQASGVVALVGTSSTVAFHEAIGLQDVEKNVPMARDTIFRIASMTKPIVAIGVLMLEDEGKLSVDDPVEKHLPEFKGQMLVQSKTADGVTLVKPPRPITLKDLLTHTSGMPGGPPPGIADLYTKRHRTLSEAVHAFSQRPLDFAPGTKWSYCNTGIDTLGRVVEVASGKSCEAFFAERLFGPLGMKDTTFYAPAGKLDRLAALYQKERDGLKRIESFIGDQPDGKYPLPAGGLYSTATDIAKVCHMMLDRGSYDGRRYLSEAAVAKMTSNHTGELRAGFTDGIVMGLGWQVVGTPKGVTEMLSPGTYGHGGAFGTQYWIDPKRGQFYILMVQRSGFGNGDASEIRRDLQQLSVDMIK